MNFQPDNNYIHSIKSVLGPDAKFSTAEDVILYFTNRDTYELTGEMPAYQFQQNHIIRNDVTDLGAWPNNASVHGGMPPQVEFLWGQVYYNKGETIGTPATYTVGTDTFELTDGSKYGLAAEGFFLFPEGTVIEGDADALADLVAMSPMRTWVLAYQVDNLESPETFSYGLAIPFDGYYYYGNIQTAVSNNQAGYLYETVLIKPDGAYFSQYVEQRTGASVMAPADRDMLFCNVIGSQADLAPVSDYKFEGKRLKMPLSVFGLDHTPEDITIIEIPTPP